LELYFLFFTSQNAIYYNNESDPSRTRREKKNHPKVLLNVSINIVLMSLLLRSQTWVTILNIIFNCLFVLQ